MEQSPCSKESKLCGICESNSSKYCCPRCEIYYCSLDCYKSDKHLDCSESFYRDCVNEELSSFHAGDEAKRKMLDILKKTNNDELDQLEDIDEDVEYIDSDDEEGIDLHERIKDLNLDDADAIWSVLTEDERNEFEALMQGEVGKILPQWTPWWTFKKETKLVQDIESEDDLKEYLKKCPSIQIMAKFSTITNVKPSSAINFNIANVLASYAFVMRYFNGEVEGIEAVTHILDICTNLNTNTNFDDLSTAVESVTQRCLQSELVETDKESLDVMRNDLISILNGPCSDEKLYYCKAALSHLLEMFNQAKKKGESSKICVSSVQNKQKGEFFKKFPKHTTEHLPKLDESKIKKCVKKLEFYLSYIQDCDIII